MRQKVLRQFIPGKNISEIAQICRIKQSQILRVLVEQSISSYTYLNTVANKEIDDWAKIPMKAVKYHAFHGIEDPIIKEDPLNLFFEKQSSLCLDEETESFSGKKIRIKESSDRYILGYHKVFLSNEDTENLLRILPSRTSKDTENSFISLLLLTDKFNLSELQLIKLCTLERVELYFLGRGSNSGRVGYNPISKHILKKLVSHGNTSIQFEGFSGPYPLSFIFLKSESIELLRGGRTFEKDPKKTTPPNKYASVHDAYIKVAIEILKSSKRNSFLTPKGFNKSLLAKPYFCKQRKV